MPLRSLISLGLAVAALGLSAVPADAQPVVAVAGGNLVSFDTQTPGTIGSSVAITGLQPSEVIRGIDFNFTGNSVQTLYALGSSSRLTTIGPLGVDTGPDVGFDVSEGGNPWAVLDVGGVSKLYLIDLETGAATLKGNVGGAKITGGISLPHSPSQLQASPSPLAFGDQPLGTTSPARTLTITLVGGDRLESWNAEAPIAGTNLDDFAVPA